MIGFVGTGVMGEPICRHLAQKSRQQVCAYDLEDAPLERLAEHGVRSAESVRDVAERSEIVFLSLPSRSPVQKVCVGAGGLLTHLRPGACVIDLSTVPVAFTRDLYARFSARGIQFLDAPVARTRAAAEAGTLSVMVGGTEKTFNRMKPLLACFATDVTHCGGPGTGQAMKLINNLVLFENVVAVAEGLALARHTGLKPELVFETLAKGSADSFALRHHGMKAMLPEEFPERAFSVEYAMKDLRYALELAREEGLELTSAMNARVLLKRAADAGFRHEYFPAVAKVIGKR